MNRRFLQICIILTVVVWAGGLLAQGKVLTLDDYPRWRRISSTSISAEGNWITYGYRPNNADDTLYVKKLADGSVSEIPGGTRPSFSKDEKWVAYTISLTSAEQEKLRKARKPVIRKAELMNLATGEKYTIDNATGFEFSDNSAFFVVKRGKSDPDAKHGGTDIILRDLRDMSIRHIGNVGSYAFNDNSTFLAYNVDAADKVGNGLYLIELSSGRIVPLDSDEKDYAQMTWNEDGTSIAVLKGNEVEKKTQNENVLLAFTGIGTKNRASVVFDPAKYDGFPEGFVVSDHGSVSWSRDGSKIFFGVKEQRGRAAEG